LQTKVKLRNVAIVSKSPQAISALPQWLHKKTGTVNPELSTEAELEWEIGQNPGEQARFRFRAMTEEEAVLALKRGKIALWIETDLESNLSYRFDPNNAEARLTYLLLEGAFRQQKTSELKAEVRPFDYGRHSLCGFLDSGFDGNVNHECLFVGYRLEFNRVTDQEVTAPYGRNSTEKIHFSYLTRFEPHGTQCSRDAFTLHFCLLLF